MSTVNTEGKLNWYLGIELSLRSLGAYLQLGLSLGVVQLRHACVPVHLALYYTTCLWRRKVTGTPEDGVLYLDSVEESPKTAEAAATSTATTAYGTIASKQTTVTRPVSAQVSGPVNPHAFLAELLAKFDALAAITHGEAADVKLMTRMMQQDLFVQQHRAVRRAAGVRTRGQDRQNNPQLREQLQHASEDNVVFRMSESDPTYASLISAGLPVAITYRDFVCLATLLSEALAWDLLWIHEALDSKEKAEARAALSSNNSVPPPPSTQQQPLSLLHCVEADCVAVMLPNSVEYNAIWMAAARSGPLHTFLDVLYRNSNHIIGSGNRGGTYRPCRTALLNTNLTSNLMLYHAIECSGSVMLLLDTAYVPLLFCTCETDSAAVDEAEDERNSTKKCEGRLRLHVPPHVKRIYLWRSCKGNGEPLAKGMTKEMERLLHEFNARAYGAEGQQQKKCSSYECHPEMAGEITKLSPPPTPPLDLFETVKPFYTRAQATPSFTVNEMRHTYLISSPRARLLVQRILSRPPPGWISLLALELHTTRNVYSGAAAAAIPHNSRKKLPSSPQTTAADSVQSRTQLERYKVKMASILSVLLQRFHHTQPVLFIYTSGTTGLPKAARFSHLRFFATGFLSRVLYYRQSIAETVVEQLEEVAYVSTHPDAVRDYALANSAASSAAPSSSSHSCPTATGIIERSTEMESKSDKDNNDEHGGRCPPIPQLFGAKILNPTRRKRNTVEATLVIICNVVLWWVRYLTSFIGLEYYVDRAAESWWYTPDQLAAIEEERRLITIYNCLPMYHTVGSVFCLGHLLHALEEQQYAWAQICRCTGSVKAAAFLNSTVPTVRMILRSKFSASQFRRDLQRYHVTVVQYIGEVLRYAVLYERSHAPTLTNATTDEPVSVDGNTNKNSADASLSPAVAEAMALAAVNRTSWRVPYAFGNGLRQDIWLECMRRLNLAHPVEFYSSTEGNIFLLNLFGIPGVVGHIPRFPPPIAWISMQYFPVFPFRVLKFDKEAQQVYRDPLTGYCSHCAVGDVGEVVGEVIEGFDMFALRRFDGYHKANSKNTASNATAVAPVVVGSTADQEEDVVARQSKVIRHVLWPYKNDCYFLSGDLVRMDCYGFCTFVDRVGDTFRWKGENVSTLEVSNALNSIHTAKVRVQEAVVYGVQLPGREGRAGMAMLRLQPNHVMSTSDSSSNSSHSVSATSSSSPSSAPKAIPLVEELKFVQYELYTFLTGSTVHNGDGSVNQSALPAYAIPLFVRMQDPLLDEVEEEERNGDEDESVDFTSALTATSSPSTNSTPVVVSPLKTATHGEGSMQTTTFKYKRGVLIKEGYDFEGSSTRLVAGSAQAWGGDATAVSTSYTRVYVLVTNPGVFNALALHVADHAGGAGEGASTITLNAGYVPLTAAARKLLGESMDKCGW